VAATVSNDRQPNAISRFFYRQGRIGYLFVFPSILFITVFVLLPIIAAFYYSFTDYDLLKAPKLAGLKNYIQLRGDERFHRSIVNTLYFAFATVPAGVLTSLALATLINRHIKAIYFFRAMFYMPVVSSFVAVSLIWLWLYEPNFGLFNDLLEAVGLPRSKWLLNAKTSMLAIIILSVWKNMGLNMVIYLAGLQGIPPHLYEAAEIDGAGRGSLFWKITLPLLAPTTYFVVIVYFIGALQMFVQVFIMTAKPCGSCDPMMGGPLNSTVTVVVLVYENAFWYLKMGYASAMSFFLFVVIGIVSLLNARLLSYDIGY